MRKALALLVIWTILAATAHGRSPNGLKAEWQADPAVGEEVASIVLTHLRKVAARNPPGATMYAFCQQGEEFTVKAAGRTYDGTTVDFLLAATTWLAPGANLDHFTFNIRLKSDWQLASGTVLPAGAEFLRWMKGRCYLIPPEDAAKPAHEPPGPGAPRLSTIDPVTRELRILAVFPRSIGRVFGCLPAVGPDLKNVVLVGLTDAERDYVPPAVDGEEKTASESD